MFNQLVRRTFTWIKNLRLSRAGIAGSGCVFIFFFWFISTAYDYQQTQKRISISSFMETNITTELNAWRDRTLYRGSILFTVLISCFFVLRTGSRHEEMIRHTIRENHRRLRSALQEQARATTAAMAADAAKSRFLAAASHDLRQPLQAVQLFLDTLQEVACTELQPIVGNAEQALSTANQLLDEMAEMARLDAGCVPINLTALAIGPILTKVADNWRSAATAKGIGLRVVESSAWGVSDQNLLEIILNKLLHNAIRFTEQGGIILGCRHHGNELLILVVDSGIGIPADQQEAIFEEFYQIGNRERDRTKGIGLGLSVTKRAAALLGHRVDLSSIIDRGSVFSIVVPLVHPHSELEESHKYQLAS